MAEIVARVVLESLINLITHETDLLSGAKAQVDLLKDDLEVMHAFLKDSAGKQHSNHVVKMIVDQISNVALKAEDVIDTYMANKIMKQRRGKKPVSKLCCLPGRAKTLHDVATQTARIKSRINNIYANIATYGIREAESTGGGGTAAAEAEAGQPLQKMRRKVEEDDVVGFVHDTQKLVSQLTDYTKNLKRDVVSIIGMGGLGKTTLAKKIYNNTHVKNLFGCRAWVNVSQEYNTRNLLFDILKCFNLPKFDEIYKMDDEDPETTLRNYLKGKKYFVVMDDIWDTDVWEEIRHVFPDELNGSRILITSRRKEVALHASPTIDPYFLPFLNDDESWELLRKKVFRGEECPFNLESLGMELAKSCKGLPLSIVVLGGILAKKEKSIQIWSKFKDCVTSYITDERTTPCLEILALSYNHLPLDLKPCFLYLGMFPEDYEIATQDLIRLWISERFVHQIGNRKVIDVAEDYLEELIDRSLIQVARRGSDGSVERCRIHDLLRDLCIKVSGEEKLFDVHSEANLSSPIKPRRLSVNCNPTRYTISQNACDTSSTRSLLFFCQDGDFLKNQWEWICKGFNFVRVLRLSDVRGTSPIPKEIEKLVFLRHLSLNNYIGEIMFHGEKVPDYICSLPYLETLELQCENSLTFSQKSISRMKQLRYVDVGMGFRILADVGQRERGSGNVDMDTLPNLQCVQSIVVDRHTASFLAKFPNLKELSLFGNSEEALASLEKNLRHLQRLDLRHFCDYLHLEVLPSTLTKVILYDSAGPNMMKTLAKLPNLLHLHIQNRIGSTKNLNLSVAAGEFPQLLVLELIQSSISSWKMERDGMPNLQRLIITDIDGNIQVPDQVWFLRALRFVKIEMDTNISAESFRNKLWELNYVKEEIVDEFKSHWELILKNGCKVSLSGVEHLFHQFR